MSGPPVGVTELMHTALIAVHAFARPENWNDPETPEQAEAWTLVDAAMLAYKQWHDGERIAAALNAQLPVRAVEYGSREHADKLSAEIAELRETLEKANDAYAQGVTAGRSEALNAQAGMVEALPEAMPQEFGEWFAKNYPGDKGGTLICDPHWHAPRIWRVARYAALAAIKGPLPEPPEETP